MKTNLNLLLIFLFFFVSCKKEDTTGLTNKVYDNGPLSTGNLNSATPQDAAPPPSEIPATFPKSGFSKNHPSTTVTPLAACNLFKAAAVAITADA